MSHRHIPIPNLIFHFPAYEQVSTKLCTQLHDATLTKITIKYLCLRTCKYEKKKKKKGKKTYFNVILSFIYIIDI